MNKQRGIYIAQRETERGSQIKENQSVAIITEWNEPRAPTYLLQLT